MSFLYTRLPSDFPVPNLIPSRKPNHRSQALHFKHIQAAPFLFSQTPSFSAKGDRGDYNQLVHGFRYPQLIVLPFGTLLTAPRTLLPS